MSYKYAKYLRILQIYARTFAAQTKRRWFESVWHVCMTFDNRNAR